MHDHDVLLQGHNSAVQPLVVACKRKARKRLDSSNGLLPVIHVATQRNDICSAMKRLSPDQ